MNNKSFEEIVRFMGGVTVEEVYGTCAIKKEEIIVEVVDIVNEEDDVVLLPTFVPGIKTMDMVYRR